MLGASIFRANSSINNKKEENPKVGTKIAPRLWHRKCWSSCGIENAAKHFSCHYVDTRPHTRPPLGTTPRGWQFFT
jgi:hypothetical protein